MSDTPDVDFGNPDDSIEKPREIGLPETEEEATFFYDDDDLSLEDYSEDLSEDASRGETADSRDGSFALGRPQLVEPDSIDDGDEAADILDAFDDDDESLDDLSVDMSMDEAPDASHVIGKPQRVDVGADSSPIAESHEHQDAGAGPVAAAMSDLDDDATMDGEARDFTGLQAAFQTDPEQADAINLDDVDLVEDDTEQTLGPGQHVSSEGAEGDVSQADDDDSVDISGDFSQDVSFALGQPQSLDSPAEYEEMAIDDAAVARAAAFFDDGDEESLDDRSADLSADISGDASQLLGRPQRVDAEADSQPLAGSHARLDAEAIDDDDEADDGIIDLIDDYDEETIDGAPPEGVLAAFAQAKQQDGPGGQFDFGEPVSQSAAEESSADAEAAFGLGDDLLSEFGEDEFDDDSHDVSADFNQDVSFVLGQPQSAESDAPPEEMPAGNTSDAVISYDDDSHDDMSQDVSMDGYSGDPSHVIGKPQRIDDADPDSRRQRGQRTHAEFDMDSADEALSADQLSDDMHDGLSEMSSDSNWFNDEAVDDLPPAEESVLEDEETLNYDDLASDIYRDEASDILHAEAAGEHSRDVSEDVSRDIDYVLGEPERGDPSFADEADGFDLETGNSDAAEAMGDGSVVDLSMDRSVDVTRQEAFTLGQPQDASQRHSQQKSRGWLKWLLAVAGTGGVAAGLFFALQEFGILGGGTPAPGPEIASVDPADGGPATDTGTDPNPVPPATDPTISNPDAVTDPPPDTPTVASTDPPAEPITPAIPPDVPGTPVAAADPDPVPADPSVFNPNEPFFDPTAAVTPELSDAQKPVWLKAVWSRLNSGEFEATDLSWAQATIDRWVSDPSPPSAELAERLARLRKQISELTGPVGTQAGIAEPPIRSTRTATFRNASYFDPESAEDTASGDSAEDLEFEARLVAAEGNHLHARRLYLDAAAIWSGAGKLEQANAALRNAERHQKRLPAVWKERHAVELARIARTIADVRGALSSDRDAELAKQEQTRVAEVQQRRAAITQFLDTHKDRLAILGDEELAALEAADKAKLAGVAAELQQIQLRHDEPDTNVTLDSVRQDIDSLNRILITVLVGHRNASETPVVATPVNPPKPDDPPVDPTKPVDPSEPARTDFSPLLRTAMHDALIGRNVFSRLSALESDALSEEQQAQRDADLETLQPFVSEETGAIDPELIRNTAATDLDALLASVRLVESRVIGWEQSSRDSMRAAERALLTAAIEALFTDPDAWLAEVEQLDADADGSRSKKTIEAAAQLNIAAGGTWADEPTALTNAALQSLLFTLRSVRLQTQQLSVADARQAATEASQAVVAAKAATEAALKAAQSTPKPTPPATVPTTTPEENPNPEQNPNTTPPTVEEDPAEQRQLVAAILDRVDSIRSRLNESVPTPAEVTPPEDDAEADTGLEDEAATEEEEEGTVDEPASEPTAEAFAEPDAIWSLISGLNAEALQQASLSELRTIDRQLDGLEALLDQRDRTDELEGLLADQIAALVKAQTLLAQQVASAETRQLAALDDARKALADQIVAVETTASANLTQVANDLKSRPTESSPSTVVTTQSPDTGATTSQSVVTESRIGAVVRKQLDEWGYGLPAATATQPGAPVVPANQVKDVVRARQYFKDAYSRQFFSGKTGSVESAVRMFSAAVRNDPTNPVYRYFLGLSLYRSKEVDKGIKEILIGARLEKEQDAPPASINQWLERIQYGQRTWLERIRRDARSGQ